MQAMTLSGYGGREVLRMAQVARPVLKEWEVLVKVKAAGVNRGDIVQREGRYPPPPGCSPLLGMEFAGEVAETRHGWTAGTRVMGIVPSGAYAQYVAAHCKHLMPVPDTMDWSTAGGIPEVWMTALQLSTWLGQVQQGERVLIHAAASGVGIALIQLTKSLGGLPYVTCGSDLKLPALLSLGAVHACNYTTTDFSQWKKPGFDVIFDPILTSHFSKNLQCLRPEARWVIYGLMSGNSIPASSIGHLLVKRVSILFTTLRNRSDDYKSQLTQAFAQTQITEKILQGEFKPMIYKVMPLSEAAEAHRVLENNENVGKVVLLV